MSDNKRPLQADDLYDFQLVSDPQISPDGQFTIFLVQRVDAKTEKKCSNLWLANHHNDSLQQFTYGDHSDSHARWSPDGQTIAFLSNRKDKKQMQIYLLPFGGGEARPLTQMEGSFAGFAWSPSGDKIVTQFRKKDAAAKEREEDEQKKKLGVVVRHITNLDYKFDGAGYLPEEKWHIWTVDADSGEATQLTDGEFNEGQPIFSPDGQSILFLSNRNPNYPLHPEESAFYLIDATGGEIKKLETRPGGKHSPSFSPDGRSLAFLASERQGYFSQNSALYIASMDGGEPKNITKPFDLHLSAATLGDMGSGTPFPSPKWSTDGKRIFAIASEKGDQPVLAINVDGSGYKRIVGDGGIVDGFSLSDDQSKMSFEWGSIDAPADLAYIGLDSGERRLFTQFNAELLDELERGSIEEIWIDGPEGVRLQGWIMKPPNFDPKQQYPSILEIHGGPFAQYGRSFMHEFHYFAANGYVVHFTNPRGSQGYGEAHADAISNQWGTVDYDDLMAWTDYVEQLPYIDSERMGVTGGSYGGYMTTLIIGKTDRFKVAAAQRLVSNLISFYGSSDMNWMVEYLVGTHARPWNDLEAFWRQSPIATIGNATTPTMIIHSERDYRCDREQGEQVFAALQKMGVPSEMILFPEESHGLSRNGRTDRRIQRLDHMLRWFNTYLQ